MIVVHLLFFLKNGDGPGKKIVLEMQLKRFLNCEREFFADS